MLIIQILAQQQEIEMNMGTMSVKLGVVMCTVQRLQEGGNYSILIQCDTFNLFTFFCHFC